MNIRELVKEWENSAGTPLTANEYNIRLPIGDAARVQALATMFPMRTETQIITELLGAALDELAVSLPYIRGTAVIAEDDHGDPIYEDDGLTPCFHELTEKFSRSLKAAVKD